MMKIKKQVSGFIGNIIKENIPDELVEKVFDYFHYRFLKDKKQNIPLNEIIGFKQDQRHGLNDYYQRLLKGTDRPRFSLVIEDIVEHLLKINNYVYSPSKDPSYVYKKDDKTL